MASGNSWQVYQELGSVPASVYEALKDFPQNSRLKRRQIRNLNIRRRSSSPTISAVAVFSEDNGVKTKLLKTSPSAANLCYLNDSMCFFFHSCMLTMGTSKNGQDVQHRTYVNDYEIDNLSIAGHQLPLELCGHLSFASARTLHWPNQLAAPMPDLNYFCNLTTSKSSPLQVIIASVPKKTAVPPWNATAAYRHQETTKPRRNEIRNYLNAVHPNRFTWPKRKVANCGTKQKHSWMSMCYQVFWLLSHPH